MSKWPNAALGEVATVVAGSTPKTSVQEYWDGQHNWVTPAELDDTTVVVTNTERQITERAISDTNLRPLPAGTVLLSSRAPIGKVAIAGVEMYCNQGFKNLICMDRLHNKYLYWFLRGKTEFLNSLGRGATFKEISKSIVEGIMIPLPPLETQRQIAQTLDTAAELLVMRKQQLAELDRLSKATFYEMFGDPVTNEKGWSRCRIDDVYEIIDGDRGVNYPKQEDFSDDGYCLFLNTGNVTQDGFNFDNVKFISEEKDRQLRKGRLKRGDIVLTTRGTVGNIVYFSDAVPYGVVRINSGMVVLRCIANRISPVYFCAMFRSDEVARQIRQLLSGTAQPQLPITNLRKISIVLPPLPLQTRFAEIVTKIEEQKSLVKKAIDETQQLFDSLMSEFFE